MKLLRKRINYLVILLAALMGIVFTLILIYAFFIPQKYSFAVASYAKKFDLEEELIYAVIRTESNFRAEAVSDAGAVGLMQIMPSTAQFLSEMNERQEVDLYDPEENIATGCSYLRYLIDRFEVIDTALAAYNAGEGKVRRWLADGENSTDGKTLQNIPYAETRIYLKKVKKFYKCYKILYF